MSEFDRIFNGNLTNNNVANLNPIFTNSVITPMSIFNEIYTPTNVENEPSEENKQQRANNRIASLLAQAAQTTDPQQREKIKSQIIQWSDRTNLKQIEAAKNAGKISQSLFDSIIDKILANEPESRKWKGNKYLQVPDVDAYMREHGIDDFM